MKSPSIFKVSITCMCLIMFILYSTHALSFGFNSTSPGNALQFDGSNDIVQIPDNSSLNFGTSTSFTLETWLRYTGNAPDYAGLLVKAQTGANWQGFQLVLVGNRLAAEIRSGVQIGIADGLQGTTLLNDGRWHHVAMVVNRSTNNVQLIVDGNVEANVTNAAVSNNVNSGTPIYLGAERSPVLYFGGSMDEVRIWNVARSLESIRANRFATVPANSSGLVAYYSFDQGTAGGTNAGVTTLLDQTSNANDGTLNNFALTGSTSNWVESYAMVVPTTLAASGITTTGFTANWTTPAIGIVTNYLLDVSTSSTFSSFVSGYNGLVVNGTSQVVTGLSSNTTYYYRVRADKSSVTGQGGFSGIQIVNVPIATPPTLSAIANQAVCDGQSISNIAITLGGDTDAVLTASSSNTAITPAFTFGGSGANRTLTITTLAGQVGATTVTVTYGNG